MPPGAENPGSLRDRVMQRRLTGGDNRRESTPRTEGELTAADQPEIPARDELRAVEEALAARRQELAELQAEQPSDSVTITTMKEELEALIATLTARRDALARQLEDASRLGE